MVGTYISELEVGVPNPHLASKIFLLGLWCKLTINF